MTIRPLRHELSREAIDLMQAQRDAGQTPAPIHLMLVHESNGREVGEIACRGNGLGEWVTGNGDQITCPGCLETVHS